MDTRYNGWSNRATWAVALHINNDQGAQEMVIEWARECYDEADDGDPERTKKAIAADDLADRIKAFYDEQYDEFMGAATRLEMPWIRLLIGDLVDDGADWREIAETFVDDTDD